MKTFEQFNVELNEIAGLRNLSRIMRAGPSVKTLKTPFTNSVRMYHGTTAKNAANIMKRGFTPTQTINPKNFSAELSNVYQTTNPSRADYYAKLMAKIRKDKPTILAVDVKKSNIRKGVRGDEFVVPVSDTRPIATGVKPIKRRRGEVIQDNYEIKKKFIGKDKKLISSHDKRLFKTPPATGAAADVIAGDKFKDAAGVGKGSIKAGTPNNPFGVKV